MFKNITLAKRINAILALSIVFLLVLATNRIDQKHFNVAQNSVNEVYNDRIVVQDHIFSISNVLFSKRLALKDSLIEQQDYKENEKIKQLLSDFQATKLTNVEAQHLKQLLDNFEELIQLETQKKDKNSELLKNKISVILETMQDNLVDLSEIQITESGDLINNAQKSLDMSALLSSLEIGFLIITGIAIQFIIFYRVKKSK